MTAYELLDVAPGASRREIRDAYRRLARRWHPDRFTEGPERDWANEKMAQINAAYRACLDGTAREKADEGEAGRLKDAQRLIDDGDYTGARRVLMGCSTRCAEWNYLFGAILMHLSEIEKARTYLTVAVHQDPASAKYARALREAEMRRTGPLSRLAALTRRL